MIVFLPLLWVRHATEKRSSPQLHCLWRHTKAGRLWLVLSPKPKRTEPILVLRGNMLQTSPCPVSKWGALDSTDPLWAPTGGYAIREHIENKEEKWWGGGDTCLLDRVAKNSLPEEVTENKEDYSFWEKWGSKLEDPQVGTQVCKKRKRMQNEVTVHELHFIVLREREGEEQ